MSRKDMSAIDKEITKLLKDCVKTQIVVDKNFRKRGRVAFFAGVPLAELIRGTPGGILTIRPGDNNDTGSFRFFYGSKGAAISEVSNRCAKKWKLTDVQSTLLLSVFIRRYGSRYRNDYGLYEHNQLEMATKSYVTYDQVVSLISEVLWKLNCDLPLKFILSPELTNLILLKSLFNTAKETKK